MRTRTFGWALAWVALSACGADAGHATLDELDALLESSAEQGFEGAILVERHGERVLSAGYGTLSEDSSREPNAQTAFDCSSIIKEVTAAIIFLLEEDGALS